MSVPVKLCRRCGETKPVTEYHRNANLASGLQAYCKPCNSRASADRKRQRVAASPEYAAELSRYKRSYYEAHRQAQIDAARDWRRRNPERVKAQAKKHYNENREQVLATSRDWKRRNQERVKQYFREWSAANPELGRERVKRRRARKANAVVVPFTPQQLAARFAVFGHKCWMCGAPGIQMDHVKPLYHDGPHMLSNLRPACASCNGRKRNYWFGPKSLSVFIRQ